MIDVLRRGSRVILDYPGQYEDLISDAYTAVREEVKALPKHAQMTHVRATLEALREEEAHLEEHLRSAAEDPEYDAALMRRRHKVRAQAERTGRAWIFDEQKEMSAAGFDRDEVERHMQRHATAEELPRVAARRAAFEVASAYLARWQNLPKKVEARHRPEEKKKEARRKGAVATLLLCLDEASGTLIRRPGWAEGTRTDVWKWLASQPDEAGLRAQKPHNSIERAFRGYLGKDYPDSMEELFEMARTWADDVPDHLFDPA